MEQSKPGAHEPAIPSPIESFDAVVRPPIHWIHGVLNTLLVWQSRAILRSRLSLMSEHDLKDVGLSRAELSVEARKPFWKA